MSFVVGCLIGLVGVGVVVPWQWPVFWPDVCASGGGGHRVCRKVTSITHVYFNFYFRRPSLSSLSWSGVGGHDGFVNAPAGALVTGRLILCHILTSASLLVIAFALIASCAGVP